MMQGISRRRVVSTVLLFLVTALACAQAPPSASPQFDSMMQALREQGSDAAYARLAEFAKKYAGSEAGAQAALALGNFDQQRNRADAALQWFQQAEKGALLREYALFLGAKTARDMAKEEQAIARLETHRGCAGCRRIPGSGPRPSATAEPRRTPSRNP